MRKALSVVFAMGLLGLSTGCVQKYSHAVSASDAAAGSAVEAEASGIGILHLTAPDLNASDALKGKCASGKLSNVETQAQMRDIFIVQLYSVNVRGTCGQLVRASSRPEAGWNPRRYAHHAQRRNLPTSPGPRAPRRNEQRGATRARSRWSRFGSLPFLSLGRDRGPLGG